MNILFGVVLIYNVIMMIFALYLIVFGIRTYKYRKGLAVFFIVMGMFGVFRLIHQLVT